MQLNSMKFFKVLDDFHADVSKYGVNFEVYNERSKSLFMNLPNLYQSLVIKRVLNQMSILSTHSSIHTLIDGDHKMEYFNSLSKLGLYMVDRHQNHFSVDSGDCIQVLDKSSMLIFANWNFILNSGYDFLTLNLFGQFELFERSAEQNTQVESKMNHCLNTGDMSFGINLHVVKSTLSNHSQLLLCNIKQLYPVAHISNHANRILVVSSLQKMGSLKEPTIHLPLSV